VGDYKDKTLVCVDCGKDFVFTAKEQEFYKEKGFENEPKRCFDCRKAKKGNVRRFEIICAECGKKDTVPFMTKNGSAVYCMECFSKNRR